MPAIDRAVGVTAVASLSAVAKEEFDVAMLLSGSTSATWLSPELARDYASDDAVGVDFAAATPEKKYAVKYFGQTPKPKRLVIGRLSVPIAQEVDISVPAGSVKNLQDYKFIVGGSTPAGVAIPETEVHVTSDGTATNDEITGGLATYGTGLGLTGLTFSNPGSGGSKTCHIASPAGGWIYVKLIGNDGKNYGPGGDGLNLLAANMTGAEPATALATQIANIKAQNGRWFEVLNPYQSKACITAIAAEVQTIDKMYTQSIIDSDASTHVVSGATDIAANLKAAGYKNTALIYHTKPEQAIDAALLGRCLSIKPGKGTFFYKNLTGPTSDNLTDTQIANLQGKNCGWYTDMAGLAVTDEGKTSSGAFHAAIRNLFYTVSNLQTDVFLDLQRAEQIDHTDTGIVVIEGLARASLDRRKKDHILASYTISAPTEADIDDADRLAGIVPDFNISGVLIIGIHRVEFTLLLAV